MPRQMALRVGQSDEDRCRLERQFSNLLSTYRARLKQAGAPPNEVTYAAAYVVTVAYAVVHDGARSLDAAQRAALRRHLAQIYAGDSTFQAMSNQERQELFEEYGITGGWIDAGSIAVRQTGDRKALERWRAVARQNFINILGAPPERVTFTSRAVEYR
jgi:hypothetical protein